MSLLEPITIPEIGDEVMSNASINDLLKMRQVSRETRDVADRTLRRVHNIVFITSTSKADSEFTEKYDRSKKNIVTVPEGTAELDFGAFEECSGITKVILPRSLKVIGDSAFYGCSKLTAVGFHPNSTITTIGVGAFADCTALTDIHVPESVTMIDDNAFEGCTALRSVTFQGNSSLANVGSEAFQRCRALVEIRFPASLETLGMNVFEGCNVLETATFDPDCNLKSIDDGCFWHCRLLREVQLPKSLLRIGEGAFEKTTIVSIRIPAAVTAIGDRAFADCPDLEKVEIPPSSSLLTIGAAAFENCARLNDVGTLPASLKTIGNYAFARTAIRTLHFPPTSGVSEIGTGAFDESPLADVYCSQDFHSRMVSYFPSDVKFHIK